MQLNSQKCVQCISLSNERSGRTDGRTDELYPALRIFVKLDFPLVRTEKSENHIEKWTYAQLKVLLDSIYSLINFVFFCVVSFVTFPLEFSLMALDQRATNVKHKANKRRDQKLINFWSSIENSGFFFFLFFSHTLWQICERMRMRLNPTKFHFETLHGCNILHLLNYQNCCHIFSTHTHTHTTTNSSQGLKIIKKKKKKHIHENIRSLFHNEHDDEANIIKLKIFRLSTEIKKKKRKSMRFCSERISTL